MKVLGISPLDLDASASLVEDGRVLFAVAEERFSRRKQHAGFPERAIHAALNATGTDPSEIDVVAYPFLTWDQEASILQENVDAERALWRGRNNHQSDKVMMRPRASVSDVPGLKSPDQKMEKGILRRMLYEMAGTDSPVASLCSIWAEKEYVESTARNHRHWQHELEQGLAKLGLTTKLKRFEHHLSHAANAYLVSGFPKAIIVTLDGYGTGLAGTVSLGEHGSIRRLHNIRFPNSLGSFYESVTSALGFRADRHAGKVVGLAAYGDPSAAYGPLLDRIEMPPGDFRIRDNLNLYFPRRLAARLSMVDVAAAYQTVLEVVAQKLVSYWIGQTGCDCVVLSGGVAANVKMNQRVYEVAGVNRIFIYPNMGDGGCGTGLALYLTAGGKQCPAIEDIYYGPYYSDTEIHAELERAGLPFTAPASLAAEVAALIHKGEVIGRFSGRMEYGPRALGNRSILYHGRDPGVNQWLNKRLGRTEFMPFAPVTLWEARARCYRNVYGAEHAAEFMTITFDCEEFMKQQCPAAVHVDGTARPQLIRREVNPEYYAILEEYQKVSGSPSIINTSFNIHEEPIVCSPRDAIRAFLDGGLDALAIGSYLARNPAVKS